MKIICLLLTLTLTSCLGPKVDDQRIKTKEIDQSVNPEFASKVDYSDKHKVLVAVIDSGVDYNHPSLIKNIHFVKTEKDVKKRPGWDFVAEDPYPSPYLAITAQHTKGILNKSDQKEIEDYLKAAKLLESNFPELGNNFAIRDYAAEIKTGSYHGTHVAGLVTQNNPEIGILSYRIFPNQNAYFGKQDKFEITIDLVNAINKAIKDGAKIINLSLGRFIKLEDKLHVSIPSLFKMIKKAMLDNPDILFVAAAGNDGAWIDQEKRITSPCGQKDVKNLICVGALDSKMRFADFTNIHLQKGIQVIYALGEDVLSTVPMNYCSNFDPDSIRETLNIEDPIAFIIAQKKIFDKIKKECKTTPYKKASGTSMATPIVVNQFAKLLIQNPKLKAEELISQLNKQAKLDPRFAIEIKKMDVKEPSWTLPKQSGPKIGIPLKEILLFMNPM